MLLDLFYDPDNNMQHDSYKSQAEYDQYDPVKIIISVGSDHKCIIQQHGVGES